MREWSNYILVLVATLTAILIAEFIIRMFMPQIGWAQRKDPGIGWSSSEYKQFDPRRSQYGKEPRVLVLGDSFLAGSGVSDLEKRFPVVLQSKLNHQVMFSILAAGGWGTDQQLLAYLQKGKYWKPDLVILAFCANNDISNILSHHHGPKKLKPYFTLAEGNKLELHDGYGNPLSYRTTFPSGYVHEAPASMRSYLFDLIRSVSKPLGRSDQYNGAESYRFVDARYKNFLKGDERPQEIYREQTKLTWSPQIGINHVSAYIHEDFELNAYQWRLFESILREFKWQVEKNGGRLVVMLLPVIFNPEDPATIAGGSFIKRFQTPHGNFTFRSIEPRERLQAISERTEITFLDPTQEFISSVENGNLMKRVWPNPSDRHFSDLGHELLADLLLRDYVGDLIHKVKAASK